MCMFRRRTDWWSLCSAFSASKFSVRGLTQVIEKNINYFTTFLAYANFIQLGAFGITVNASAPGLFGGTKMGTVREL